LICSFRVQPSDEDEETRNYRLEIEKQKQLREKIMRDKELKRRRAAEEKLHEVSQFSFIFVGVEQYERFYTILMPLLTTDTEISENDCRGDVCRLGNFISLPL